MSHLHKVKVDTESVKVSPKAGAYRGTIEVQTLKSKKTQTACLTVLVPTPMAPRLDGGFVWCNSTREQCVFTQRADKGLMRTSVRLITENHTSAFRGGFFFGQSYVFCRAKSG